MKNNPSVIIEWVEANYTGKGANPYKLGLIQGLLEKIPEIATELIEGLPN